MPKCEPFAARVGRLRGGRRYGGHRHVIDLGWGPLDDGLDLELIRKFDQWLRANYRLVMTA
jgi:hypothetical protein